MYVEELSRKAGREKIRILPWGTEAEKNEIIQRLQ